MSHSDLELSLATPIIIHKHMDDAELQYELELMQLRSKATSEFVAGRLEYEDFLDALETCGTDIDAALKTWSSGLSYLG
jgi:hypothetical protein